MFKPKITADSYASTTRIRATSFLTAVPTCKLAELRTHRSLIQTDDVLGVGGSESRLSLNANSSRAIPVDRIAEMCKESPYEPLWTLNQPGMSGKPADDANGFKASWFWQEYLDEALRLYEGLKEYNIHKQDANLLFHPFAWTVCVITGDELAWKHFFKLRTDKNVYPAIRDLAIQMQDLYGSSTPAILQPGEWHIPFADQTDSTELNDKLLVSASCCARISYANEQSEPLEKHLERARKCLALGHQVFEHQLMCPYPSHLQHMGVSYIGYGDGTYIPTKGKYFSNVSGFVQLRKLIEAGDIDLGQ